MGNRVVRGGELFCQSALINENGLKGIEDCIDLAPLHNPSNIKGILAARKVLGSDVPQVAELTREQTNIITFHLGNGASVAAIRSGRSIDTSVGMRPLEGLVMGTRCRDLDASIVNLIGSKEGLTLTEELREHESRICQ